MVSIPMIRARTVKIASVLLIVGITIIWFLGVI
jgi:hypothetical protein